MSIDSQKIAKNTIFLYIRMLLLLAVSLYTSRILLKVIGIDDYGIYNLIAGFVTFLTFITNSLVSSMQRYFNVALGKKDIIYYQDLFSMSINILVLFSGVILLLGETLGLWFVKNYLNIPTARYGAAICVYHLSLLTFIANTLRTPFHASIIAHEKMSFYAYISLFEVLARLGMIFLLIKMSGDHLIIYAILYLLIIVLVNVIYILYCKKQFPECKYNLKKDNNLFKDLINFSSWVLIGQASVILKNQGESILINRFFSVAVNAAMGIALQVTNALEMFVLNFQTAFNPQLIQTYASNDFVAHKNLLFRASKFSYFLLLIMVVPITANLNCILNLWLVEVPEYANYFIYFILISYLFNALSYPFVTSLFASGNIKNYQISLTAIFLCGLLLSFIALYLGAKPYAISIVAIVIQATLMMSRLYFIHKYIGISYKELIINIFIPILIVTAFSVVIPYFLHLWAHSMIESFLSLAIDVIYIGVIVLFIGMRHKERHYVINNIKQIIKIR